MSYIIYPYNGFSSSGNIKINFGMKSNDIKSLLGEYYEFQQSSMEYYKDFRIDYDKNGEAAAFEFFSSISVILSDNELLLPNAVNLFSLPLNKINKALKLYDPNYINDGASTISLKYGIGTYGEGKKCETIIIFRHGYYD